MTKRAPPSVLDSLLRRRIVFVAGKGGSGKTTVSAALAVRAAQRGMRVLAIEVDAKGDLARALGSAPVGYEPVVVRRNLSLLALHLEDALQQYLHTFFKVPRFTRVTPLARVFDFIATGVPGPREMLVVGKIAFEERERIKDGSPKWDLIIVDSLASGHIVSHLRAAEEMLTLTRGGVIKGQLEWVDATMRDTKKTAVALTATPEEMSVVEALDLATRIRTKAHVHVAGCFVDRVAHTVSREAEVALAVMNMDEHRERISKKLGGSIETVAEGVNFVQHMHDAQSPQIATLEQGLKAPTVFIPLVAAKPGLMTTRVVANFLGPEDA